jgi:hypothetical protein
LERAKGLPSSQLGRLYTNRNVPDRIELVDLSHARAGTGLRRATIVLSGDIAP